MTLRDYQDFTNDEPLVLPINGKRYTVPPVSAKDGLYMSAVNDRIKALASKNPDPDLVMFTDEGEDDLYKRALGTLWDELIADNVPFAALRLAGMVAFVDFSRGREYAEALWQTMSDPNLGETAAAPNRAARRAATKTRSAKTGAAANTTKKPASGSGTKSRPKSSPTSEPPQPA